MMIPKNSRLNKQGTRELRLHLDLMLDNDSRFYKTIHIWVNCHPDFSIGRYIVNFDDITRKVTQTLPSLKNKKYNLHLL